MAEGKGFSRQLGMKVKSGYRGNGDSFFHYQSIVVRIDHAVEDEEYGMGVAGINLFTREPVIIFSNPVPSERKAQATKSHTMTDWVKGLPLMGVKFTLGPKAIGFFNEISTKKSVQERPVKIEGKDVYAQVLFCQWIECWASSEAVMASSAKDIMVGFGIAENYMSHDNTNDVEREMVRIHYFEPKGPHNRFNSGGTEYPVVFSFKDFDKLLECVERECSKNGFDSFMVRMIDDASGKIAGSGMLVSVYDSTGMRSYAESFARMMSVKLGLTRTGLEQLVSAEGFTIQIFGCMVMPCSYMGGDNGRPSLVSRVLKMRSLFPRDEEGNIVARTAAPLALRGTLANNGGLWLDRLKMIGYTGGEDNGAFNENSEIIAGDAYSGNPIFKDGKEVERGLDRIDSVFVDENNQPVITDSIREIARLLGCKNIQYPGNDINFEYFDRVWNDSDKPFPKLAAPAAQPSHPVQEPQAAEQPKTVRRVAPAAQTAAQAENAPAPETQPQNQAPRRMAVNSEQNAGYPKSFGGSEDINMDEVPF